MLHNTFCQTRDFLKHTVDGAAKKSGRIRSKVEKRGRLKITYSKFLFFYQFL